MRATPGIVRGSDDSASTLRFPSLLSRRAFFALKTRQCPHCRRVGFLNRHSFLRGNDPGDPGACLLRGQRVLCSKRGNRRGCGRTSPVFLAGVLPGHTISALWLSILLGALCQSAPPSLAACAGKLRIPFPPESLRSLLRRMRLRIDRIRTALHAIGPPPPHSSLADPLLHAFEHLRALFSGQPCPVAALALHCQREWGA